MSWRKILFGLSLRHDPSTRNPSTHKQLQELEDTLVCQDVECVSGVRIDDRQPVDLVPNQRGDSIKQARRGGGRETLVTADQQ